MTLEEITTAAEEVASAFTERVIAAYIAACQKHAASYIQAGKLPDENDFDAWLDGWLEWGEQ